MSDLSAASYLAYYLSAYEASLTESAYIDTEHLWIGLCKVEDMLEPGMEAPPELKELYKGAALTEIRECVILGETCGIEGRNAG